MKFQYLPFALVFWYAFLSPVLSNAWEVELEDDADRVRQVKEAADLVKQKWELLDEPVDFREFHFRRPTGVVCTDFKDVAFAALIYNQGGMGRIVLSEIKDRAPLFLSRLETSIANEYKNRPADWDRVVDLRSKRLNAKNGILVAELAKGVRPSFKGIRDREEIIKRLNQPEFKSLVKRLVAELPKAGIEHKPSPSDNFEFAVGIWMMPEFADKDPQQEQDRSRRQLEKIERDLAILTPKIAAWEDKLKGMEGFFDKQESKFTEAFKMAPFKPRGFKEKGFTPLDWDDAQDMQTAKFGRYREVVWSGVFGTAEVGKDEIRAKVKREWEELPGGGKRRIVVENGFQWDRHVVENGKEIVQKLTCY